MGFFQEIINAGAGWWLPALTATLVAISVFCIARFLYGVYQAPYWNLPGPWHTKFTGLMSVYYELTGRLPSWVHALHEQYGKHHPPGDYSKTLDEHHLPLGCSIQLPVEMYQGTNPTNTLPGPVVRISPGQVDISDITAAHQIHSISGGFRKGAFYARIGHQGPRTSFNETDPAAHRARRKLLSPPFTETALHKNAESIVRERVETFLDKLQGEMQLHGVVDLWRWSVYFTTDVIGQLAFGEFFGILEAGEKNQYVKDIDALTSPLFVLTAMLSPIFKLARIVPFTIPLFTKAVQISHRVDDLAYDYINRYRTRYLVATSAGQEPPFSLLSRLFETPAPLTDQQIIYEGRLFIVAGSDTTSTALTYLIWSICRPQHAHVRKRILEELASLQNRDDASLKSLPFLDACLTETLRVYAPGPHPLQRVVPAAGTHLAGRWFPGGATVSTQAYSLHRDKEAFGPDEEVWRPERWLDPEFQGEKAARMKEAMMPWGGSSRQCLGLHLAKMELRMATASFLERYPDAKISERKGMSDRDMEQRLGFIMTPKGRRCLMDLLPQDAHEEGSYGTFPGAS